MPIEDNPKPFLSIRIYLKWCLLNTKMAITWLLAEKPLTFCVDPFATGCQRACPCVTKAYTPSCFERPAV